MADRPTHGADWLFEFGHIQVEDPNIARIIGDPRFNYHFTNGVGDKLLSSHKRGEWGERTKEQAKKNLENAKNREGVVVSRRTIRGTKIYVVTQFPGKHDPNQNVTLFCNEEQYRERFAHYFTRKEEDKPKPRPKRTRRRKVSKDQMVGIKVDPHHEPMKEY